MGRYLDIVDDFLNEQPAKRISASIPKTAKKAKEAKKDSMLHGIPLAELHDLAGDDWPKLEANPKLMKAFADAVVARRLRERGEIPAGWTETVECAGCGLVALWPGLPEKVQGCPWCFNRIQGLPVPNTRHRADL